MRDFTLQELNNLMNNKMITMKEYNVLKSMATDYEEVKNVLEIKSQQPVIKSDDENLIKEIVTNNNDTAYQLYKNLEANERESAVAIAKENLKHVEKLFNRRMNTMVFKSNVSQIEKEVEVWSSIDESTGLSLNQEYQQSMRIIEGA